MAIAASAEVHPSAHVEPGAAVGEGCRIGPFCLIGSGVTLGPGVEVKSHAVVTGDTAVGEGTVIFPFATVGEVPQDLKFRGERSALVIGARNRIREHVTINLGTEGGGGVTRVGDDCLLMAGSHVAHDCQIGNRVILVNNAALAGHCILEDEVIVGGLSGVHQFVRIGRGAMIGAVTMVIRNCATDRASPPCERYDTLRVTTPTKSCRGEQSNGKQAGWKDRDGDRCGAGHGPRRGTVDGARGSHRACLRHP